MMKLRSTYRQIRELGQFLGVIDEILESDKTAPPKQRHTAKRIYERLRDEYGYTGCSSQVRAAVGRAKKKRLEVFVPLSHPPGQAQFDFGEATVIIAGEETKAALAVTPRPSRPATLPPSSSSVACPCGPPMTTPPSRSRRWTDAIGS
jgi:transposase